MSNLSAPHFHNEEAAYAYVEARLWPNGPVCPHCGGVERLGKMKGKSTRVGAYKCYQCRKPFTVKIGTVFEDSKVPMRLWLQAMYLIAGSKKGVSSNQLSRILGVTLKTAWFMSHRIREAMHDADPVLFGGEGGAVQADETWIGNRKGVERAKGGMRGVYQFCSEKHLHRYLAEFDFRYSHRSALGIEDTERTDHLLRGVVGKRLTYETTCARA